MCPPFRPGAIQNTLRTYRPGPTSRDRKRKGRSFEDEMGQQQEELPSREDRAQPHTATPAVPPTSPKAKRLKDLGRSDDQEDGRRHIDLEI